MKRAFLPVILFSVFLAACAVFYLSYQYDNKYTAKGTGDVVWLVDGWAIYRGNLFTPEDFSGKNPPLPYEYIYIGQYGGFEMYRDNVLVHPPNGSATYRLIIDIPPETKSYSLELPEIFSAYRLYINGALMKQMGEPNPDFYQPLTRNSIITFDAANEIEIIVAATNHSHFYSGMVYPPAFGNPDLVLNKLNIRLAVRIITSILALVLGILYLGVWILTKKEKDSDVLPLYFTLLCVCFVLYTCYPIVKTLISGSLVWYTIENFAYCAMFLFIMLICKRYTDANEKWFRVMECFAVFVCCWSLLMPFLASGNLHMLTTYSRLIEWYSWLCALYLTISAAYGLFRGRIFSKAMPIAIIVFDASLVMTIIFSQFEPILFGWFTEMAGAFVVLTIGIILTNDVAGQYRLRQAMEYQVESVSRMLDVQRAYLPILTAKEEEIRVIHHDIRHHVTVIRQLIHEPEKLKDYLDTYDTTQVKSIQVRYCQHDFVNMLLGMYAELARQQKTAFVVHASLGKIMSFNDVDLCVLISNLLENALEASQMIPEKQREISISIGCELGGLGIFVKNKFDGIFYENDGIIYSRKQPGRIGIGLASVESICKQHGGRFDFYINNENVFHVEIAIPVWEGV